MKQDVIKHIEKFLKELGVEHPKVSLDIPTHIHLGDYSTSVALAYSKQLSKKPVDLAGEIAEFLVAKDVAHVSKINVVTPGFINFFFDSEYFGKNVSEVLDQKDSFGKNKSLKGQKTIIEYTVCNVLKPMHIGHLMGNVIGESLSRVIESSDAEVKRNNYQGDSGLHIAKAVWGILKQGGEKEGSLSEKSKYIGEAYALGANAYEDDPTAQEEIKDFNKKIFEKSDEKLNSLYQWGRKVSLDHFEEIYKKLGTKFDYYFFESEVTADALKIVQEFLKKGVFEESDGAIVFKGEKFNPKLHTRVFVSSQGLPMYESKDIAHAIRKYHTYKFDKSIIVTANEQSEYFKVVLQALHEVNSEIADMTQHVAHGLLKLPDGKMSSRKGNTITGEGLIDQVKEKVKEKMAGREDMSRTVLDMEEVSEIVAIGAIKYSILRQAIGGDIIFDFDKSISFEGDSGPYLQYSVVRAKSLLKKAKDSPMSNIGAKLPEGWETANLERYLERFPNVVSKAGSEYAPHHIVTYLIELAGEFNSFYANHKIIDAEDKTSPYRLTLTEAFAQVMENGLTLLGIKVPERM